MKSPLFIIAACYILFTACGKSGHGLPYGEDHGCVERVVIPVSAHSISPAEVAIANSLLAKYSIDYSNLRYYRYRQMPFPTFYAPFTTYDQKLIQADQYANGLRIFGSELIFNFFNDSLNAATGDLTKGTTLDTIPRLNIYQLRKLFVDNVERFDQAGDEYKDVCLKCEFGYYDLNAAQYGAPELLVKAWRVTPKNTVAPSEYPLAYYKDDGNLIYYDNGIRTFH